MLVNDRVETYLETLRDTFPNYLYIVEKEALEMKVPIIRRSIQDLLRFYIKTTSPMRVLEVGTAVGFSALLMNEYLPVGGKITTIEKVPQRIEKAKTNFNKFDKKQSISLLEGDASDILKELCGQNETFDFVFMDAAKGQYSNFLPYILSMLGENGYLITDNVMHEGDIIQSRYAVTRRDRTIHSRMREYLYTITHHEQLETLVLPIGDGIAVSKKVKGENTK